MILIDGKREREREKKKKEMFLLTLINVTLFLFFSLIFAIQSMLTICVGCSKKDQSYLKCIHTNGSNS